MAGDIVTPAPGHAEHRSSAAAASSIAELRVLHDTEARRLLERVFRSLPGTLPEVLHSAGVGEGLTAVIRAAGASPVAVPERFHAHDLAAMADAVSVQTRMACIVNPHDQSGSFVPGALLAAFLDLLPQGLPVLLDESGIGFVPPSLRYDSVAWLQEYPDLLIKRHTQTEGAGRGMHHLIGAGRTMDAVAGMDAEVCGVAASGKDRELESPGERTDFASLLAGVAQIRAGLDALGLSNLPTCSNFVAFQAPGGKTVLRQLQQAGVDLRAGNEGFLCVTIGSQEDNRRFLEALQAILKG